MKKIDTHFSPLPFDRMRDWDWKRADMSRKNLAGPTRFLLFNLISVLEEELNFRFSVLCFASQSTKKEKDGKSGKEKKLAVSFLGFFSSNAQLSMHCFSLSFLIYVTVFIIFILFPNVAVGGRHRRLPRPPPQLWLLKSQEFFLTSRSFSLYQPFTSFLCALCAKNWYSIAEKFTAVRRWESAGENGEGGGGV